jgi:hypothetical protein
MPDRTATAGTGILFAGNRILTTAEIVAAALVISPNAPQQPDNDVFLELPLLAPNKILRAKVVQWRPLASGPQGVAGIDNVAVLELQDPLPQPTTSPGLLRNEPTESHYETVVDAITEGTLVPFFGAGVNLCGRPRDAQWRRGEFLPSGQELAVELANTFKYPWADTRDLVRDTLYVALIRGLAPINTRLRYIFDANYPPTPLHRFFARLPGVLREKGHPPHRLIVTTNYDDVLERAFA